MAYQAYPGGSYPQDGQQFAGYGQPQPPPKKKVWPIIAAAFIFLFLLLFGGCTYAVVKYISGPSDIAQSYATDLENGDLGAAYDVLCSSAKAQISFEDFQTVYVPSKPIKNIFVRGASFSEGEGQTTDTFIGEVTYTDDTREDLFYDLVKEGDDWKVCNPPVPVN